MCSLPNSSLVMAPTGQASSQGTGMRIIEWYGQTSWHLPQLTHLSGSIWARPLTKEMASFGAVHLAGTREAAAAGVGNHVLRLDAGGTGNVNDAELRLFGMRALKGFFAVLRQAFELIGFFFRRKAEAGHAAVF